MRRGKLYDIDDIVKKFSELQERRYSINLYTASLRQLVIRTTHLQEKEDPIFITFQGVEYMRLYPYWEDAVFTLGTPEMCRDLLLNLEDYRQNDLPSLFYISNDRLLVQIICKS